MVKPDSTANKLESMAANAVRALLGPDPNIRIAMERHEQSLLSDYRLDRRIDFSHSDIGHAVLMEFSSDGAPRYVRSAVYQLKSYRRFPPP